MENGGSKRRNLREWEKKRNCPFDAKKVCPVTFPLNCRLVLNRQQPIERLTDSM